MSSFVWWSACFALSIFTSIPPAPAVVGKMARRMHPPSLPRTGFGGAGSIPHMRLSGPKIGLWSNDASVRTHLVATGQFVTAMGKLNAEWCGMKVLPIDLAVQPWPVVIATLKGRTLSPVVELFIEFVRQFTKPLRQTHRISPHRTLQKSGPLRWALPCEIYLDMNAKARWGECPVLALFHRCATRHNLGRSWGYPDHLKFHSSMTLFARAAPHESVFETALQRFFGGKLDQATLDRLGWRLFGRGFVAGVESDAVAASMTRNMAGR